MDNDTMSKPRRLNHRRAPRQPLHMSFANCETHCHHPKTQQKRLVDKLEKLLFARGPTGPQPS